MATSDSKNSDGSAKRRYGVADDVEAAKANAAVQAQIAADKARDARRKAGTTTTVFKLSAPITPENRTKKK